MTNKKLPKPKKKDKEWQEKVAKNLKKEEVELGHTKGFERFKSVLKRANKKSKD